MQHKTFAYLLVIVALLASMLPATALAQHPDSEETLLEQAKALAAEQNPTAPDFAAPLTFGEGATHPLFVGVDDTTVPAYQVDVVTNGFMQAFLGFQVWGSAYDPVNDKVYFNNGSTLYEWPVGGAVATLGAITDPAGAAQAMVGLAFYNGTLYGIKNIANEAVYTIDTTTRVATVFIDYVDADFDLGGFAADPNTGEFYATNDDTTPFGSGLFRINPNGTGTKIADYPAGQTDIDGLAVSDDGFAYLVTDEPGFIYVWDFVAGAYVTPLNNPWTTSEVFSAGAWIWEAAQEPSISLAKTVGTDPSICAATDQITVAPNTDVTYCYEVTNTGGETLNLHDLDDSELGSLLSGFSYALAPGASAFITETTNIAVTTVNTATWTAYNPQEPPVQATATATVTVEAPNIDVDPLSLSAMQPPDTTTQQMLNVANTGAGTLTWEIDEEDTTVFPQGPAVIDPASAFEDVSAVAAPGAPQAAPENVNVWRAPEVVLYDNGPLVNYPGAGAGGADESRLQTTSLGMNTLGFGHQVLNNNWVADDFTVSDAAGWTVDAATFFSYQTNSTTASTVTNVNWILYNGDPSAGGTVITSGSGLQTSVFANIYRTTETTIGVTNRPIMATTVNMGGLFLPAGTYWLAWQTDGTLASGPWAPPITINGQTVTGNGLQSLAGTAAWAPALDIGTGTPRQGFPFVLEGSVGGTGQACSALSDIPWLSLDATAGSNAGGTNTDVAVTFDSTGLPNGVYTGNLCVTSNDPDAGPGNGTELVIVPVELTVETGTAVALSDISAAPLPAAGLPLAALPAVIGLALGAAYVLRRKA